MLWAFRSLLWAFRSMLWAFRSMLWAFRSMLWAFRSMLWAFRSLLWAFRSMLWAFRSMLWAFRSLLWVFGYKIWGAEAYVRFHLFVTMDCSHGYWLRRSSIHVWSLRDHGEIMIVKEKSLLFLSFLMSLLCHLQIKIFWMPEEYCITGNTIFAS